MNWIILLFAGLFEVSLTFCLGKARAASGNFPVLLDPTGQEVFRYVGRNNADRYGAEKLTAKIAELKKAAAK